MNKKFEFDSIILKNIPQYKNSNTYHTTIYSVSSLKNPKDNTLIFVNKVNEENIKTLKQIKNSIILVNKDDTLLQSDSNCILHVDRPRREYAIILDFILKNQPKDNRKYIFKEGYCIGENVNMGENVIIEPFVFIDHDVTIGNDCIVKSGAKIRQFVIIGKNCILKENCVIGGSGFGVERDTDVTAHKIPHLGGVTIGDNVEIGALTCICSGTIEPTCIEDYVKIDDSVFVAHNCHVEKGTVLIANSEISGSVHIEKNCWISPNSCIRDGLTVGNNAVIGMGAVIVKNVDKNVVVVGNPGRVLRQL